MRFDDEGRPARIEVGRIDSDRTTTFECTYDLAGRPVHARSTSRRGGQTEWEAATRWEWRAGRLTRVVHESDRGDRAFEVHYRGNRVHLVSVTESSRETWTGACAPVFFGACSPVLNPVPPGRRRARMPALRSRAPRWREASTQPELVGRVLRSQSLTLARLRAAYPGYHVWTDVTFTESSPGTAVPVVCVGNGRECTTRIHHDEQRRWRRVTTRDPMFSIGGVSPGDLGMHLTGDVESDIEPDVSECTLRADIGYVECRVRGIAGATVLFAMPDEGLSGDGSVGADDLANLRAVEVEVRADR